MIRKGKLAIPALLAVSLTPLAVAAEAKASVQSTDSPRDQTASTRNERSTPPNSVLPSSPAIARKRVMLPDNSGKLHELVMRTQIALLAKGYQVGRVNGELHARTVVALYHYQEDAGQDPSGKLTDEVLSSLGIVEQ